MLSAQRRNTCRIPAMHATKATTRKMNHDSGSSGDCALAGVLLTYGTTGTNDRPITNAAMIHLSSSRALPGGLTASIVFDIATIFLPFCTPHIGYKCFLQATEYSSRRDAFRSKLVAPVRY